MNQFTKESILKDLRSLGINYGDVLFVTANIMKVGMVGRDKKSISQNWIDIFKELVGDSGGVVAASYSQTFHRLKKNKECVFNRFSKATSGALSNIFIRDSCFIRSDHPTNSYIGYGAAVEIILNQHNHLGMSYDVPLELINLNCKNLMLGTIDTSNAPMSMHVAQQLIGDTLTHPTNFLLQSYYFEGESKKLFTKSDSGGCSRAGHKIFKQLCDHKLVTVGYVGDAYSAVISGPKSLDVTLEIRNQDSLAFRCLHEDCLSCSPSFLSRLPSKFFRYFS